VNNAKDLLEKYIKNTEKVFEKMKIIPPNDISIRSSLEYNISLSKNYFEDSKYYFNKGEYVTGIVCIAYCEGILDACRNFGWIKWDDEK
jgi:FAD synthetase